MAERKKLGELLIEAKVISAQQLQVALSHQKQWGGRLGHAMIDKGFLTEDVLVKFLSLQLNFPSVTLSKLKINMDVLQRVPRDIQEKRSVVPIAILKEGKRESLILAMCDPTDMAALDEVGFATGLKVKPVIATESAIKKFLSVGTQGTSYREQSVSRVVDPAELGRVSGAGGAPIGENELVLGDEPSVSEVILGEVDEPPLARGTITGTGPAAPVAARASADPFISAVLANASPAPMPPLAPPAPFLSPAPIPPPETDPFGVLPIDDFGASEDRTEFDIPIATVAPLEAPEPPTATRPAWEPPLESFDPAQETAWETAPGLPTEAAIGGAPIVAPTIVARGALVTDEPAEEISLPGPEPLLPPADLLVDSPSKSFAVPSDLELAEPTVLDENPLGAAIGQIAPSDSALDGMFADSVPETFEPPVEMFAAPPPAGEAFSIEDPAATWTEPAPPQEFVPPVEELGSETPAFAPPPDWAPAAEDLEPPPFDTVPSSSPTSTEAGAVPVMTSLDHGDEGTVLNAGAFEPTWSGEVSSSHDLAHPNADDDPGLDAPSRTMEAVHIPTSSGPAAPSVPAKTVVSPEPAVPAPVPPAAVDRPELTPEPSRATGISDEQAALNATITKKLKLLNAIAELLLEKGLITEEEMKEKISRKRGG